MNAGNPVVAAAAPATTPVTGTGGSRGPAQGTGKGGIAAVATLAQEIMIVAVTAATDPTTVNAAIVRDPDADLSS